MIKEKLAKVLKENKEISKSIDTNMLEEFVEKVDKVVEEETERKMKEKLNEETNKIKKELSEQYEKKHKTFIESYEKVSNKNQEKKLDIIINEMYNIMKISMNENYDKLMDSYVSTTLKENAKELEENVTKEVKKETEKFLNEEKQLLEKYVEANKGNVMVEKLLGMIKTFNWEDKVQNTDNVKKVVEENTKIKKAYKKLLNEKRRRQKEEIFNENFGEYSDMKKEEIKKYIKENLKSNKVEDYKKICEKIVNSNSAKRTLLNEQKKETVKKSNVIKDEKEAWEYFVD